MNALIYTNEYPPNIYGGAGVHVEYLTRELSRLIEVDVRCYGDQLSPATNPVVKGYGVDSRGYLAPKPLHPIFTSCQRAVDWNRDGNKASVVHCHTWYTHLAGIMTKLNYGIPLVITAHSLEPLRPWKREQLAGGYDFSCWVERTAIEMADAIIAVSEGTKADILKNFSVAEDKIHVIYNGIDTVEYQKVDATPALQRYGIPTDQPYVFFVGRITRQKGIIHLVEAIRYMHPGYNVVLCAGAPDTPEIAAEMKAAVNAVQAERAGVFWIAEMVEKKPVIQLYSGATVFCCPSVYEPFGIINLEAMACQTPVVASAVGGIKEVVVHGETGYLVPMQQQAEPPFEPVDPAGFSRTLADHLNRLLRDAPLRQAMGAKGRQRVEAVFSWSAIAHQVLDLYRSLVPRGG